MDGDEDSLSQASSATTTVISSSISAVAQQDQRHGTESLLSQPDYTGQTTESTTGQMVSLEEDPTNSQFEIGHQYTLFSAITNDSLTSRKTEPQDIPSIVMIVNDDTRAVFGNTEIEQLFEKCAYSCVIIKRDEPDTIVGAVFVDNAEPLDLEFPFDDETWKSENHLENMCHMNSLFIHLCAWSEQIDSDSVLTQIIVSVLQSCFPTQYIIVDAKDDYIGPFLFNSLARMLEIKSGDEVVKRIILYDKDIMFPHLRIRDGRESDLDDLLPLIPLSVSTMEEHFNRQILSDVISLYERNTYSTVAEWDGLAVGIITVTTDVNYELLNKVFHLEPFHGLFKPHPKDRMPHIGRDFHPELHKCDMFAQEKYLRDSFEGPKNPDRIYRHEKKAKKNEDEGQCVSEQYTTTESFDVSNVHFDSEQSDKKNAGQLADVGSTEISDPSTSGDLDHGHGHSTGSSSTTMNVPETLREKSVIENIINLCQTLQEEGILTPKEKSISETSIVAFHEESVRQAGEGDESTSHEHTASSGLKTKVLSRYRGLPNAIAIQLCAIEPKYSIRFLDLVAGAFANYPNREYLIVEIAPSKMEPTWLDHFLKVTHKKERVFNRDLYILHRVVLTAECIVRPPLKDDHSQIVELLASLNEGHIVEADLLKFMFPPPNEPTCGSAFVMSVTNFPEDPIVGLAVVSTCNPEVLLVNYNVDRYMYYDSKDTTVHGYVHHFIMNPLFNRKSSCFMLEIMRQAKKTNLYHGLDAENKDNQVTRHQSLLNNLDDWIPLCPRKRIHYDHLGLNDIYDELRRPSPLTMAQNPISALLYSKKFGFETKLKIHTRIVFVGASTTAISCIERLLGSPFELFKNITIIDPFGIPSALPDDEIRDQFFVREGGVSLSYNSQSDWVKRLGLETWVSVCYGWVTKILKKRNVVVVNKNRFIPYDILILTPGQQFSRPDCPIPEIEVNTVRELLSRIGTASAKPPILNRQYILPRNVFTINTEMEAARALSYLRTMTSYMLKHFIIVHGENLESFSCIRALLSLGIQSKRIVLVTPPRFLENNENSCPSKVRGIMKDQLQKLGIRTVKNYSFKRWSLDKELDLAKRVYFVALSTSEQAEEISFACCAFFSFVNKRVHDVIASAVNDAFLAFDGGIFINSKCQTRDNNIWAAGPAALYEKKLLATEFNHKYFQSEEIGRHLADLILERILESNKPRLPRNVIPKFYDPIVHFTVLPGNLNYMYVKRPGGKSSFTYDQCEIGTEIVTGSCNPTEEEPIPKFFMIRLNENFKIEKVECLAQVEFSASNLSGLYGHHETILNNLLVTFERKEIPDFYDFFAKPWFAVFCHGGWHPFLSQLKEIVYNYHVDGNQTMWEFIQNFLNNRKDQPDTESPHVIRHIWNVSGLKRATELHFLDFLKFNKTILPMYARPDFVETLMKERIGSSLYET